MKKRNPIDICIIFFITIIFLLFFSTVFLSRFIFIKPVQIKDNIENLNLSEKKSISIESNNKKEMEKNIINEKNYSNSIDNINSEINNNTSKVEINNQELKHKEDSSLTMSIIGDIMCHNSQYQDAYKNGTYNFSYVFDDIKPYIENADIAIGNLETTFAGQAKGYSSYPSFNTPEALAYNLKDLGIDVLSTANNHSLDSGYSGVESTINFLDDAQISHTGTFKSLEEQNKILYKDVNGIKIAFLAFTYGTNGISIPNGKEYCINLINKDFILYQLNLAKQENPDLICVNMHWGDEYHTTPNNSQEDLANFLFENGANIILGSHPHVLEPMEKRSITFPDGSTKEGFIIYSLGNFMSGQVKENTKDSIILSLKITKNGETSKISIDNFSYIPIYTFTSPSYKNYKVLDIKRAISNYESGVDTSIGNSYYTLLKTELEKIDSILIK